MERNQLIGRVFKRAIKLLEFPIFQNFNEAEW